MVEQHLSTPTHGRTRVSRATVVTMASALIAFASLQIFGVDLGPPQTELPTRICDPIDPPHVLARCLETGGQPTLF